MEYFLCAKQCSKNFIYLNSFELVVAVGSGYYYCHLYFIN